MAELIIEDGTVEIEEMAYQGRDDIVSVVFPKSLKVIGEGAFADCDNLKYIQFNEGLQKIGNHAFQYCDSIGKLVFPSTLREIGNSAFSGANRIGSIVFNEGLETIGDTAFLYLDEIREIVLPSTIKKVGEGSFQSLTRLEKVTVKSGILGEFAFFRCPALREVTIGDSVTEIQTLAFGNCPKLKKPALPAETRVQRWAFLSFEE